MDEVKTHAKKLRNTAEISYKRSFFHEIVLESLKTVQGRFG